MSAALPQDSVELSGAVKPMKWILIGFGSIVLLLMITLLALGGIHTVVGVLLGVVFGLWPIILGVWGGSDRVYVDPRGLSFYNGSKLKWRVEWSELVEVRATRNLSGEVHRTNGYLFVTRDAAGTIHKRRFHPLRWARRDAFYAALGPVLRTRPELVIDKRVWPYFQKHLQVFGGG